MASKLWRWPKTAHREAPRGVPRKEAMVEAMWRSWAAARRGEVARYAELTLLHLRRRRDGTPSAREPVPTLSLDGGVWSSTDARLKSYEHHLKMWKARGLYHGPTELTYEKGSTDGKA
jgi:hypothetical protein